MIDMHKDTAQVNEQCSELLEETKKSLPNAILKQLLVSMQQRNLDLCMEYCLQFILGELGRSGPGENGEHVLSDYFITTLI